MADTCTHFDTHANVTASSGFCEHYPRTGARPVELATKQ